MTRMAFDVGSTRTSLFGAILDARAAFGASTPILEDPERAPLSYGRLVLGAFVIGGKIAAMTSRGEAVGVMLPNVNAVAVTLLGLSAYGRVAAMLNFTAGPKNLRSAAETAGLRIVVTSRRFVESAKLDEVVTALEETQTTSGERVRMVYLEDVRASVTSLDKVGALLRSFAAKFVHRRHASAPDEPAVILFTSGSEGKPKGVVLSNANLLANMRQIEAHIGVPPLGRGQVVLNPLPVFHSYGLPAASCCRSPPACGPCFTRAPSTTGRCRRWRRPSARPSCSAPTPSFRAGPAPRKRATSTACASWWRGPSGCASRRGRCGASPAA